MIKVAVRGTQAVCEYRGGPLTVGQVGAQVMLSFSGEWAGLRKVAVAQGSGQCVDVLVTGDGPVTLPHEVLTQAGALVRLGVYGVSGDGTVVIPTVYAELGRVQPGAEPSGDESVQATLPVWGQILAAVGDLTDLSTQAKDDLVSAINEVYLQQGYYTPQVDEAGTLSWQASRSGLDPVEPVNIRGPQGYGYVVAPQWAESLADCTDVTRVYVLPDGYLYTWQYVATATVTGVLAQALDPETMEPGYNTVGYRMGKRLTSAGAETAASAWTVTGLIPCTVGDVIRTQDLAISQASYSYVAFYDASGTLIATVNGTNIVKNGYLDMTISGLSMTFTVTETYGSKSLAEAAYFRLSLPTECVGPEPILTVNEALDSTGAYTWASTGYAYQAGQGSMPDYVAQEAADTAERVRAVMEPGSFVMAVAADAHLPYNSLTLGAVRHTGMALGALQQALELDMAAFLGDYARGAADSTQAETLDALDTCHTELVGYMKKNLPIFWTEGNHDDGPYGYDGVLDESQRYGYLARHGQDVVTDPEAPARCYGYRDFPNHRLRVVCLNTCDTTDFSQATAGGAHRVSPAQLRWLAETGLDLSDKQGDWAILVMSHTPLNWPGDSLEAEGTVYDLKPGLALEVLDAFTARKAGTITADGQTISYDFTQAKGQVLAAIHGHTHNFRVSAIGSGSLPSVAVPQICPGRYNEYTSSGYEDFGEFDSEGQPVYYRKTADSRTDTSFNVLVVNRRSHQLHCIAYGAGYDRTVEI